MRRDLELGGGAVVRCHGAIPDEVAPGVFVENRLPQKGVLQSRRPCAIARCIILARGVYDRIYVRHERPAGLRDPCDVVGLSNERLAGGP